MSRLKAEWLILPAYEAIAPRRGYRSAGAKPLPIRGRICHSAGLNRVGGVPVASRITGAAPRTATTPAPIKSIGRQGRRRSE